MKDLFIATSRGCNFEVNPPGMTAMLVLCSLNHHFTGLVKCPLKESSTNKDCGCTADIARRVQIFSIHHNISSAFIHPSLFARIITPFGKV